MLSGNNGILKKATDAKANTDNAQIKERIQLAYHSALTYGLGSYTKESLEDELKKEFTTDYSVDDSDDDNWILYAQGQNVIIPAGIKKEEKNLKSATELYDGVNNPSEEGYDENAMHIGDYVNYDAGVWTESKNVPTSDTPNTFGGYSESQSRNSNANGMTNAYSNNQYEGWRIWDVNGNTVTLISSGCPEVFYIPNIYYNRQYIGNSELILTGSSLYSISADFPSSPRNWSLYKTQHSSEVKSLNLNDFETWYKKYINSEIIIDDIIYGSGYDDYSMPENTTNKLISVIDNGFYYWIGNIYLDSGGYGMYYFNPNRRNLGVNSENCYGVRLVTTLKSDVKFEGTPEKIEQNGFSYNKWTISKN